MSPTEEPPDRRLPEALTVGGRTWQITDHLQDQAVLRGYITPERLAQVLDNWVIRGIRYDKDGRPNMAHLGWVEYRGSERLMRVGVSMDDQRINTAFLDTTATGKLDNGDMEYFRRNYQRPEVRS